MRKVVLSLAIAAMSFVSANAQEGFHVGGGLRVALPMGDFGEAYSFGIGAELQGEYMFSENLGGVISAGYTSFMGKTMSFDNGAGGTIDVKVPSMGVIPVLAGIRFYPSPQFFVGAKAGMSFMSADGESDSQFTYEPQVGYNAEKFLVSLGYNAISGQGTTWGSIGLSAIYKFN